uniref:Uncharacterized protein n=1 Tax=Anguilla anguilla TaxID=7936 RepID=A0A0E9PAX1_ANGAN
MKSAQRSCGLTWRHGLLGRRWCSLYGDVVHLG